MNLMGKRVKTINMHSVLVCDEVNIDKQIQKLSALFESANQLGEPFSEHIKSTILFNKQTQSFTPIVTELENEENMVWMNKQKRYTQRNQEN